MKCYLSIIIIRCIFHLYIGNIEESQCSWESLTTQWGRYYSSEHGSSELPFGRWTLSGLIPSHPLPFYTLFIYNVKESEREREREKGREMEKKRERENSAREAKRENSVDIYVVVRGRKSSQNISCKNSEKSYKKK